MSTRDPQISIKLRRQKEVLENLYKAEVSSDLKRRNIFYFLRSQTPVPTQGRQEGTINKSDWASSRDRQETDKLLRKTE